MILIGDADERDARVGWPAEDGAALGSLGGWRCRVVRQACLDQPRRPTVAHAPAEQSPGDAGRRAVAAPTVSGLRRRATVR
jgi:hypothetical protein